MRKSIAILVTIGFFALVAPSFAAAHAGVSQPAPTAAYDRVASCFSARAHLVALALIDESTSLRKTDREARRVDALVGMLRMLGRYGRVGEQGQTGTVEVQLAGFGTVFASDTWTTLSPTTMPGLEDKARQFAGRNTKEDTDFAAALLGAQEQFALKDAVVTATGDRQPCRMLLLFTDGQYILSTPGERPYAPGENPGNFDGIRERGRDFLCEPGQLADQLRDAGTTIVAIGLVPTVSNNPPDQSFLQSVAEGAASGRICGTSSATPGKYIAADGFEQLIVTFDSAIGQALGGTPVDGNTGVPVCAEANADDTACEWQFALDAGLREFHMLLNLGAPGIEVELRSPDASRARMRVGQPNEFVVSGAKLSSADLGELDLVIDGRLPVARTEWIGTWTVRFIDPTGQNSDAVARSQLIVFGGLVPVTEPKEPRFQVGERTEFDIQIVDAAGSPKTPVGFARSAVVTATLIDPQGEETAVSVGQAGTDGTYAATYQMPEDADMSYVDLRVTLDVVTSSGIRLQPRSSTHRVPVRQPSAYPSLSPMELVLTSIIDQGEATGAVTVTGGLADGGCVWFDEPAYVTKPPNTGEFAARLEPSATSERDCLRTGAKENVAVSVAVRPERVRSGVVDGGMTVHLKAAGGPERQVVIPVRFEMQHAVDEGTIWVLFVAIVLLGVLLPVGLLWLMNWLTAKFVNPGLLRYAEFEVVVTPNGVVRAGSPRTLREFVNAQSFVAMRDEVPLGKARRFSCGDLSFRRRIPAMPWTLPFGEVRADGSVVLSSTGLGRRDLRSARVDFELNRTWVFIAKNELGDVDDVRVLGTLHLFVTEFDVAEKAAGLAMAVELDLPPRVDRAVEQVRAHEDADDSATPESKTGTEDDIYQPPRHG